MAASSRAGSMEKALSSRVGITRTWGVTATMHAFLTELCACKAASACLHQMQASTLGRAPGQPGLAEEVACKLI